MGRGHRIQKEGLNRGAWTAQEDKLLSEYIKTHGERKWSNIPKEAGLKRCGKSCRLRWLNYLRPDIKRGNITLDEEDLIVRLHKLLGNRWSLIAGRLPGRTDNEIKNYWNTALAKREKDQKKQSINSDSKTGKTTTTSKDQNKAGLVVPVVHTRAVESESGDELSSRDRDMDFHVNDMSLPDFLNSDFTGRLSDFELPPYSDSQLLLTNDKMVENWIDEGDDNNGQTNFDSDFGFLSSFLESTDQEWVII